MRLWQEIHLLLDTSTLMPGDDIPSMIARLLPFQMFVRIDLVATWPEVTYPDRREQPISLQPVAVRCKAGDARRCFMLQLDCRTISTRFAFNSDAKGKNCEPADIEHMPGFAKKLSQYPGPTVLPSEVLHTFFRLMVQVSHTRMKPFYLRKLG